MSEILPAKTALADIETTAITYDGGGVIVYPSRVHLIIAHDLERDLTHVFGPDEESLRRGVKFLEESTLVVFHNGIGFDVPVLEKVFGFKVRDDRHVVDSLVLCQLFYSNIKEEEDFSLFEKHKKLPNSPTKFTGNLVGKHSLEAWGLRLDPPHPKGTYAEDMEILEIDPWAEWTPEMQAYAIQDVMVLKALWTQRLASRYAEATNKDAIAVEHYMAELMDNVKRTGIRFDKEAAEALVVELEARSESLVQEINEAFPPRLEPVKWVFDGIPLGMPALDESDRAEYETLRRQDSEHARKRCAELENSGPQQRLTRLMFSHAEKDIYRPRFNLPEGYLREWWGDVFTPKVTRTVKDKAGNVLYVAEKDCPFVKVAWTPLNPGSRQQIIRRLLELGWIPTEFTESGLPELSEVELHKIEAEFPVASVIAKYLLIQKRLGQIKTGDKAWLNLIDPSSFIHPTIRACSTVTFRATHSDPNVSQVPSVKMKDETDSDGNKVEKSSKKVRYEFRHGAWYREETDVIEKKVKQLPLLGEAGKWGWECRACFTVPDGFMMVGADLAGIEMRAWAHYLWKYDGGSFADVVLNKDVHEENRVILGFNDRRKAKEWLYACVPMDTQCLTRKGWKTYDQLEVGEDILTYNSVTKMKEWQPLEGTVFYENARLIEMSTGEGFCVTTTPDHRWFTRRRTGRKEHYYVDEVTTTDSITGEHHIIQNAPMATDTISTFSTRTCAEKYGVDWSRSVLEMSTLERDAFLLGFLLADGYRCNGTSWGWSQLKGEISEGLLLASYLCWDKAVCVRQVPHAKNPMVSVRQSTKSHVTGQRLVKREVPSADVWCPRTKNGSWVMRQGDTITITGNCMYGAGDEKLGFVIEPHATPERQKQLGAASRSRFMSGLSGYEQLNNELMFGVKRGWLKGIDNRRVPVRKQHAALNSLLQSTGAILSKYWIIYTLSILENEGHLEWGYDKDFSLLLYSHDELQFACRPDKVEFVQQACVRGALKAGEKLKFRLPVEVGLASGINWAETH